MTKKYDHTFAMIALEARKRKEVARLAPKAASRLRSMVAQLRVAGYQGPIDLHLLIEACGEDFLSLSFYRKISEDMKQAEKVWDASGLVKGMAFYGSTPEEAVGRLLTAILLKK